MKSFSEWLHEDALNEGAHDYITSVHSDKESDVTTNNQTTIG